MGVLNILAVALVSAASTVVMAEPRRLTLLPKCEDVIRAKIQRAVIDGDETASIEGVKLLYGGSHRGLHYNAVVIVRVSYESEPEDYLVVTKVSGDAEANRIGCRIKSVESINLGSLPDIFEAE